MVEWKKLGEVCKINRGVRVVKKNLEVNGVIPVYQNSLTPLGYYESSNYPANTTFVISAGAAGEVGFSIIPFWAADDCLVFTCPNNVLDKYVFAFLQTKQMYLKSKVRKASVPRLSRTVIEQLQIPIPSKSEQARIVGILDTFTASIANLKAQIKERRKQYEYYRDQLLDLEGKDGVEMKTLGEVCELRKERIASSQLSKENYVSVENLLKDKGGRVDSENFPKEGNWVKYCAGDILIGNIRPYLRKIWLADRNGGTNGDVVVVKHNEDLVSKYLYYILSSEKFFIYYNQTAKGGKMPRGEKDKIFVYPSCIPSKSEQSRIVAILDQFESSIANLEAQLKEREKQYEYYRNQLLTFE